MEAHIPPSPREEDIAVAAAIGKNERRTGVNIAHRPLTTILGTTSRGFIRRCMGARIPGRLNGIFSPALPRPPVRDVMSKVPP